MISDPLFHNERLLCCVFAYMYICMYAGLCYVLYVSPRFLENCDVSEKETFVFLVLFIRKEDSAPICQQETRRISHHAMP